MTYFALYSANHSLNFIDVIIVALRICKHSIVWANVDTSEQMQLSKPRQG